LFYAIGIGNQMPMVIAKRLIVVQDALELDKTTKVTSLSIKGTEGMVLHFAECCQPIPGDSIVGQFMQGRGIQVHASNCPVIKHVRGNPEQIISLCWDENVQGDFWVDITVDVANQRGVLAALATTISEAESNIGNISVDPRDGRHNAITFSISVLNRTHLARVMRRLRANKVVMRLYRNKQGD
jgi:guanosine-3',5'-bis(diphosphate) 3'-pyrophosphohydrolase